MSRWAVIDHSTDPSERQLDRFLMMYGRTLKSRKSAGSPAARTAPLKRHTDNGSRNDSSTMISLPFGGTKRNFHANDLVLHLMESGRNYIIQGQTDCRFSAHPKPHSLDAWLYCKFAENPDTKQAVNKVVSQLTSTGLFVKGSFRCPDSGRTCKGIRLVSVAKR